MTKLLAIVPARSGSVGLPDKVFRTVGGVPMLLRTLRLVSGLGDAVKVVVSTNDPEVAAFCRFRDYEVLDRPDELARHDAPLIEVARHAADAYKWRGDIALFQPTCPLLTLATAQGALTEWRQQRSHLDWAITAQSHPHITWRHTTSAGWAPVGRRVNRQQRELMYRESGAIQIMRRSYLHRFESREMRHGLLPIPAREALDVDDADDLVLADRLARTMQIRFIVGTGHEVGTGHVHRAATLARALGHHAITWEWHGEPGDWAQGQLEALRLPRADRLPSGLRVVTIFDCLTPETAALEAAAAAGKVYVLEDEGEPNPLVDLLVNDILTEADVPFAVLRAEFRGLRLHVPRPEASRVLVTFGGTDPAELTARMQGILDGAQVADRDIDATFIHPLTLHPDQLRGTSMAEQMVAADVVVTSQGRTVFECAATGVPCISIAANEREDRHVRIPGVTYLGLHSTVADQAILDAIVELLASVSTRATCAASAKLAIDGRGLDRLVSVIEGAQTWN